VKHNWKTLSLMMLGLVVVVPGAFGVGLVGSVSVNQTSDTASAAKAIAINSARRQILYDVLSKYAEPVSLNELIQSASDDDLMNFISSSSVSNEQMSTDSYSANITMDIDNDVVRNWLTINNVQNWVPGKESVDKSEVFIVVSNGVSDWAELKRAARESGFDMEIIMISGNQIYAKIPSSHRTRFTAGIRGFGWKYADNSGVLQIWK
jgi:hypothetical protein